MCPHLWRYLESENGSHSVPLPDVGPVCERRKVVLSFEQLCCSADVFHVQFLLHMQSIEALEGVENGRVVDVVVVRLLSGRIARVEEVGDFCHLRRLEGRGQNGVERLQELRQSRERGVGPKVDHLRRRALKSERLPGSQSHGPNPNPNPNPHLAPGVDAGIRPPCCDQQKLAAGLTRQSPEDRFHQVLTCHFLRLQLPACGKDM